LDGSTGLALILSAVAVAAALVVPSMAFRYALHQDELRRLWDRRADLYVDLLTEAMAEQKWFEWDIADDETQKRMAISYTDLRLPPLERARLSARANIFGSPNVNRLFNGVQSAMAKATLLARPKDEGQRAVARLAVGKAFDALEDKVRHEMGTDKLAPVKEQ
jgi:hypothetical protein